MHPIPTSSSATGGGNAVALTSSAPDWPSLIPAAVRNRNLACVNETPDTAKPLLASAESFCDGTTLSIDVERSLFESFVEDDYDGRLHLTTLRRLGGGATCRACADDAAAGSRKSIVSANRRDGDGGDVVGLVFWREVPPDEMGQWLDFDSLSKASVATIRGLIEGGGEGGDDCADGNDGDTVSDGYGDNGGGRARSLVPVRQESLRWLQRAAASSSRRSLVPSTSPSSRACAAAPPSADASLEGLTHAWVKIELLAVRRQYWGKRYGSLLLACALYEAYQASNSRAVLHVAGGRSNVPAVRLYERFGFVGLPSGGGGVFRKPDRDLFVLGNIGRTLRSLEWGKTLALPDGAT